jgi:amino acid adenylation domain-containing protein
MHKINDTTVDIEFVPVTKRFEQQVKSHPDKLAVVCDGKSLTYNELNARANRIANSLISKGAKAETAVGVLLDRSVNVYIARQGILKSGGAFVVASPEYPEERVRYILEDSGAKFVLTTKEIKNSYGDMWSTLSCTPLIIDELLKEENDTNPDTIISEHDLCYCIYTSGSTGKPKGVMIEHGNLANFVDCNDKNYETIEFVNHSSVVLALAAMTFDMSIMEEFISLTCGHSVMLATDEEIQNPELLAASMIKYGVDGVLTTPSYLSLLLDLPKSREALKQVRVYDIGAEAFQSKLYDKIIAVNKDACIINGYGPTETTISCTAKVLKSGENVTIGVPNSNVYTYIIDEAGNEMPDGQVGELLICGKGVGRGYVNLPERTAQSFIEFRGMRGYRSGDLALINSEGEIEFHGRKDNQVKLRGLRIELGEIETVINSIEGVTNSIVIAVDNTYLCAYYTATREISHNEISDFCAEKLAYYMVPDVFIQLEEMPLTQNKKIDKKALPKPIMKQGDNEVPKNSTQQKIFDILVSVTGNSNLGINTDFYRSGLSSLSAMQFNVRLADEFGVVIKTSDINRNNTIVLLEKFIANAPKQNSRHEERDVYPLTGSQKGIFVECEKHPESVIYNIPFLFTLEESIDVEKLKAAVSKTISAHSYMNTRFFVNENGELCQKPQSEDFEPEIIKISDCEFEKLRPNLVRPFKLDGERLYRIEIYVTDSHKYMLIDFHHIMTDGNSFDIFFNDLSKAYCGEELKPETYTGFDAALSEESEIKNGNYKKSALYYDSVFSGVEAESLPIFDKKESTPTKGLAKYKLSVTTKTANAFCENTGITLNTLFTGVFGIVAARYSNANDALFATIYNGRNDSRLENTVCMLVKTLPVYCHFDNKTTISVYMTALQEQLINSMANDIVPFADISAKYGITSDLLFAYQAELSDDQQLGDTIAKGEDLSLDLPKEPLLIQVRLYDGAYYLTAEYRSDLYNADTIENILDSYNAAMESVLNCRCVSDVSILSKAQEEKLDQFNNNDVPFDTSKTVVDMFCDTAKANGSSIAVVYKDTKITYAELERLTRNLAGYIKEQGFKKEDAVAVLIPRCEYMAIASMGIARSGCAYQPLDYTYPQERLLFMTQDSGAKLLITTKEMRNLIPDYCGDVLLIDDIPNLPEYQKPLEKPAPQDLFILLYTSGSTGVPKGCMLEFGNITAFCHWYHKFYKLDNSCHTAAYASYGFDASMMDIFCPLTAGAQLHIIAEDIRLDLIALNDYFEKNQITHGFITTQVGRQFALGVENHSLRCMSTGGEKLVPLEPPKNYEFFNVYGPTECTVFTTTFLMDKYYDDIPIGKPLDNMKLYVVDAQGHRLPVGACGELLISGRQISRGYLNRPEKTSEVYTSNPYCNEIGYERMYHSGDIVRYLGDGNISFVGRRDAQVKIRGFRIELSEVEEIIRRFPAVKDATVAVFEEDGGGKYIAAYVVSDEKIDIDELNNFILETKPAYMVPAVTMQIDKIPLNQNQKVNKRALPKPEKKIEEKIEPKNEVQKRIFECVADAIGHNEFGITTDIYYAGLTSVSAIRLNVLLAKAFDVVIKTSDLKDNPTIVQLEKFILSANKAEKNEQREVYPLTNTQYGVFIDSTANMGTTVYNIPYLFKLDSEVDLQRLKSAVEKTVEAHPYLKVQLFMNDNGDICQKRNDNLHYEAEMVDGLDLENIVRPFNLFNEWLFRFEIHTAFDGSYLFMDLHHIIADGTSLAVIIADINKAYSGEALEIEEYTYYDASLDNEKLLNSEAYKKAENFYKNIFENCKGNTDFYPDRSAGIPKIGNLAKTSEVLSKTELEALCKKYGITENVFFIGAFGAMLARYNFDNKAVFTTIYHGRNDSRLTDTVGMLVKTLPVLCNTESDSKEYFTKLQNEIMGMIDNDIYPFSEISREFNIHPNAMVIYQGDSFNFDTIGGKKAEEIELNLNAAKAPISLSIIYENGKYVYELEYRSDMFDKETVEYLLENFDLTAKALLDGNKPADIHLMFDEASTMVNDPEYMDKTFVDLFKKAACEHSQRTAVIDENGSITYAELDKMSDLIAEKLVKNGFGTEQVAGILCGRTREYVAAYVGVMKAGGAYMPLDPEYPQDRLEYMLSDSGAENILAISEYVPLIGSYNKNIIYLDDIQKESANFAKSVEFPTAKPENLAYIIYTSGSTGKPKGVMLEQRNLVNMIEHVVKFHNTVPEDIYGEFASFCFDASVHDLFPPLAVGAALYLFPESIRKDAVEVCRTFEKEGITVSTFPTQMGELVAETLTGDCALRILTLGGEKFKRFYDRHYIMVNGYGPTENTVSSTEFVVDKDYKNIPIGKSQLNVRSYIVDEDLKRVPVGASGELCHAGRQIARGYHNLPEKTAAAFIENPFAVCKDEQRLYRTGDMVRMKGDGNIEYIGRIDSQIKIRGYRVELSEIEGAILRNNGIVETAVIPVEQNGTKYIAAYYTGKEYSESEWQEFLKPIIPEYMLPTYYIHMDAMPITPGGKIDKRALPKPEISTDRSGYTPPETPSQIKLCKLFEKALGMENIGIDDDFFALGGTSLSASKVAVMCLNENIPLVYTDIFKYPTVRQLVDIVYKDEQQENNAETEFSNYSYYKIDKLIAANDIRNVDSVKAEPIGNILITGATGFLGIHILKEYLENYDGKAYCLVRKGKYQSPDRRLMNMLMYYFDSPYAELFGDRIVCIDGDITDACIVEALQDIPFDTLINCAACVKHFAARSLLEKINVTGVENLIELCKITGKKLIQISSVSVGGEGIDGTPPESKKIREKDLYFSQRITNEYIRTKFLAERAVLAAVADGLNGKVVRVGNLMSRNSDGEFQINFITNGFLRTLRGYAAIGKFPMNGLNESVEFSPIDSTAAAVLKVAGTNSMFTVFHASNSHRIFMGDVVYAMRQYGFDIEIVSGNDFEQAVNDYAASNEGSDAVSGLIAYTSRDDSKIYTIDYNNSFTTEVLYRLGYKWPITDDSYLKNAIKALDNLNFFDDNFFSDK